MKFKINSKTSTLMASMGAALVFLSTGHAALIAHEGFNYDAGAFLPQAGWAAGSNPGSITVTSPGSTYTGFPEYAYSGNKVTFITTSHTGAYMSLGSTYSSSTHAGQSIYISFLASRTGADVGSGYTYLNLANGTSEINPGFGIENNTGNWNIQSGTIVGGAGNAVSATQGEEMLVVVEVNFTETGAIYNMYLNPTSTDEPATAYSTRTWGSEVGFDALRIQSNRDSTFDEIRVGTSWADVVQEPFAVVPEPSSLLLSVLGSSLLFLRKRRLE